ncbi:unnamed protein product [Schistosoma intercalatum]|nr:unnamed protein product [Schistosoma intercalatum]
MNITVSFYHVLRHSSSSSSSHHDNSNGQITEIVYEKHALGNEPIPRRHDVESKMVYFRENENLLQAKINDIIRNKPSRLKAIQKYVKCKSEQQHEESFSLFLKEMNKQFENEDLMSFPDYLTLKDCFIKQENILERQKSNSENEVCKPRRTFSEQVNYEFASKNYQHTLSLLQRMYGDF